MGESFNNANAFNELKPSNRRLGWPNLTTQEHILTTSTPRQLVGSRRQLVGSKSLMQEDLKGLGKPLKLSMVHGTAMDSPTRTGFGSREEEIEDFIAMDETRVRGLYASVIKVARNDGGDDNVSVPISF